MRIVKLSIVILAATLAACGGKKPSETEFLESLDSAKVEGPSISEEVIGDILQQIPAPLEISVLLKESGQKYNVSYLNTPDNLSKYNSSYKKALNLGIYGTDLGYTNIYEQNQDGVKYMASIKDLADGLNIGQFFDIETIGRLATNSKNLDSLLLITTQNFNSINHYLQTQSRANLSILLLAGGWLEAVHIVCNVAQSNLANTQLQETIGEQKVILENIMLLLSFYKDSDPNMASLLNDMEAVKKEYEKVNITYTYKESTFEVVDGVMIIKDNSTTTIDITPENIAGIGSAIKAVRNKIIN
ncbi:hypothetical protein SanaruYs_03830 [Chryseotalea sanaruensis]|uniref:Uncharacterized protein n=1 Tax=Chryseotalea sanaruensis TaxID=2482724 RepID=A0A401U5G3_9BACT|nr:hypothetical protein [Chryseotalea sanaruensis]GCC50168.1 hypothetical protein SanaruYs_03830 [Chryseotalea sanaruensis]